MKAILEGTTLYIIDETIQQGDLTRGDNILFTPTNGPREVHQYIECDGYGMGVKNIHNERCTIAYSHCAKLVDVWFDIKEMRVEATLTPDKELHQL